jgi:hypothetical protein
VDAKDNCQVLPLSRPPAGHIVQRINPWHIVSAYSFNLPYTKEYENIESWQRLVVMHRVLAAAAKNIKNAVSQEKTAQKDTPLSERKYVSYPSTPSLINYPIASLISSRRTNWMRPKPSLIDY